MSPEHLIQTLGLPGLVIGSMLEGDSVTFLGGILAHRGLFGFEQIVLAATLGAMLADNVLFLAARFGGSRGPIRRLVSGAAAQRMRARLDAHAVPAILAVRFLYGMKTVGAVLIGTTTIPWWRYAVLDLLAILVWAHLLAAAGYLAGQAIQAFLGRMALHWHLLAGGAVFLAAAGLLWYLVSRRRRKGTLP